MKTDKTLQNQAEKSPFRMKYIFSIVLPLLFIAVFILVVYTINQNYSTSGDTVIRSVVGQILQKDPNSLNKKDFLQVTELDLSGQTIEDIRLLKEFKNLRKLDISSLKVPIPKIPLWKNILIKMHIIKNPSPQILFLNAQRGITGKTKNVTKSQRMIVKAPPKTYLNLRPLKNLSKLETLNMNISPIESLDALTGLKNLTELDVYGTDVSDLGQVRKLSNLKTLNISQTKISDISPLEDLSKLQRLTIYKTDISNIDSIKNLSNLTYLDIRKCNKILHSQIDELQECLPELIIFEDRD